jgi:hypothetical protein
VNDQEDRIKALAREAAKSGGIVKTGFHWDHLARLEKAIADAIHTALAEVDGDIYVRMLIACPEIGIVEGADSWEKLEKFCTASREERHELKERFRIAISKGGGFCEALEKIKAMSPAAVGSPQVVAREALAEMGDKT